MLVAVLLNQHAVLTRLLPARVQVLLQRLLLARHSIQLGGVLLRQLVTGFSQLTLLAVQ